MTRFAVIAAMLGSLLPAGGAQTLESNYRTAGPAVHRAFDSVREFLQASSAVVRRGRQEVVFGVVVSQDGFILTKASELGDVAGLSVTVDRESYSSPQLVAEDPVWDVALLKIEASNLVPVILDPDDTPAQGTWVVANGATTRTTRRVQVGVVSANEREVRPRGGAVLGIGLKEGESSELIVAEISEGSGAALAGMKVDDRILSIDGDAVETREDVAELLGTRQVGDHVTVTVVRDGSDIELKVELAGRADTFGEEASRNDMMSGEYSERRSGFPRVMQHDIIGNRHFMGGPVFNLDGRCVGMNIARFSRCETYAIPARELKQLADRLVSAARKDQAPR